MGSRQEFKCPLMANSRSNFQVPKMSAIGAIADIIISPHHRVAYKVMQIGKACVVTAVNPSPISK